MFFFFFCCSELVESVFSSLVDSKGLNIYEVDTGSNTYDVSSPYVQVQQNIFLYVCKPFYKTSEFMINESETKMPACLVYNSIQGVV